jgi:hypothetical protein
MTSSGSPKALLSIDDEIKISYFNTSVSRDAPLDGVIALSGEHDVTERHLLLTDYHPSQLSDTTTSTNILILSFQTNATTRSIAFSATLSQQHHSRLSTCGPT